MHSTLDRSELDAMSGSLFSVGISSPEPDEAALALVRSHKVGGIILFGRNIAGPVQVASLCRRLQKEALAATGTPLFLAVDQEGGRVARLKPPFTLHPGASEIGQSPGASEGAARFAAVTAAEMGLVGLNMDMAPVLDVPSGDPERHLTGRTFGSDPELVAALGVRVIDGLQRRGVSAVGKHFPGLGEADLDPHRLLPTIHSSAVEMEQKDLVPFRAAIKAGVCGIMTSHAVYPGLDPGIPATLSRRILTGLLREKLGFGGLIITDDLEMGAVARGPGVAESAAAAMEAGADILLVCEKFDNILESIDAVRKNVLHKKISATRLRESTNRVRRAKAALPKDLGAISIDRVKAYFQKA